jgi:hypothetical protein
LNKFVIPPALVLLSLVTITATIYGQSDTVKVYGRDIFKVDIIWLREDNIGHLEGDVSVTGDQVGCDVINFYIEEYQTERHRKGNGGGSDTCDAFSHDGPYTGISGTSIESIPKEVIERPYHVCLENTDRPNHDIPTTVECWEMDAGDTELRVMFKR